MAGALARIEENELAAKLGSFVKYCHVKDLIVKPFDKKELSARVKAVLRRYTAHDNASDDEIIKFDNIEISLQKYELKIRGRSVDIPPKELELLYFLASNFNRVFTRDQLQASAPESYEGYWQVPRLVE